MKSVPLGIKGLIHLFPTVFEDERGFFFESYRNSLYLEHGIDTPFVQDNISYSKYGTLRGLHFQRVPGQAKLVTCLEGEIWDVAVDIRTDSSTFGHWEGVVLSGDKHNQLFIPEGFAHGFCVLSPTATVLYKVSAPYDPKEERSVRWNDPAIQINWPIQKPLLSLRDQNNPSFKELFQ